MGTAIGRAGLLAAAALAATAFTPPASAAPPTADRIEQLEAQIRALSQAVEELRQEQSRTAAGHAATATTVTAAHGPTVPAIHHAATANNNPPATSPDQPRSIFSGGPGPSQGGATILAGRPSIQSADGRFVANLHGVMQFDASYYDQRRAGPIATDLRRGGGAAETARARDLSNGTNFRRARIGIDGRLFGDFDYNVLFDFGGSGAEDASHIQELWIQYTGLQPFRLRVGAYPPPVGLEDQNSTNGMPFLERPAISDISRSVAGGDFREGATLAASRSRWFAAVSLTTRTVGTINATGSTTSQSFDQNFGGIARIAVIPFQGDDWLVHVGAHGTRVFSVADSTGPANGGEIVPTRFAVQLRERPELRVDGTRLIDTGVINARHVNEGGLELGGQYGPVYVQGEYERITIERRDSPLSDPKFSGWYVEGSWIITGERRKYNTSTFAFDGPPVDHPFDLKRGTFGAVELAARYSAVDLNYRQGRPGTAAAADAIRGGEQKIFSAGINWYPNPDIRFMIDYQRVVVNRLSPNAATFVTPVGAEIGQRYNSFSIRSQLAF